MVNSANFNHYILLKITACVNIQNVIKYGKEEMLPMATIIKQTNKKSGVCYVYSQESYWVPDLKQPRSHRRLIGKIDPATGAIVPTGKSGRRKKTAPDTPPEEQQSNQESLKADLLRSTQRVQALECEVAELKAENKQLVLMIKKIQGNLMGMKTTTMRNLDRCIQDCTESLPQD